MATGALDVDVNRTQPAEALLSGNAEPSNAQQFVRDVISVQASVVSINYVTFMRLAKLCLACAWGRGTDATDMRHVCGAGIEAGNRLYASGSIC